MSDPPPGYRKYPLELPPHRDGQPHVAHGLELDPSQATQAVLAARMRLGGEARDQQLGLRAIVREIRVGRQQETSGEIVLRLPGVELDTIIPFRL